MKKLSMTLVLGLMLSGSVFAQQTPPAQANPAAASAVEITKADVEKFKKLQPKITTLQEELGKKITKAESPVKARELQAKAQEKMISVLN